MKSQEICFGAISVRKKFGIFQVFLVKHKKGNYWGFPKGHSKKYEEPKETVKRELLEEVNLKVKNFLLNKTFVEEYEFFRDQEKISKKVIYYLVKISGDKKLQKEEILDAKWVNIEQAFSLITFNESKDVLNDVKNILRSLKKF